MDFTSSIPFPTLIGNSAGSKVRRVHTCSGPLHLETPTFILLEGCGANVGDRYGQTCGNEEHRVVPMPPAGTESNRSSLPRARNENSEKHAENRPAPHPKSTTSLDEYFQRQTSLTRRCTRNHHQRPTRCPSGFSKRSKNKIGLKLFRQHPISQCAENRTSTMGRAQSPVNTRQHDKKIPSLEQVVEPHSRLTPSCANRAAHQHRQDRKQ